MAKVIKKFANKNEKSEEIEIPTEEGIEEYEDIPSIPESDVDSSVRDIVTKEVTGVTDEGREEHTLKITPSPNTEAVVVDTGTKFSDLSDHKVNFVDFYQDTRTFLAKANSTKFILITFLMITIPLLLIYNYISADVYKDMIVLLAISYLGVDVYEKKSMIKK
jgi:hypothetical protein